VYVSRRRKKRRRGDNNKGEERQIAAIENECTFLK